MSVHETSAVITYRKSKYVCSLIFSILSCLTECNCHGHSEACHFDAARYQLTGGVSGGVCDNCQHYRTGAQCERCQTYMYQDPEKTMDDPRSCIRMLLPPELYSASHQEFYI